MRRLSRSRWTISLQRVRHVLLLLALLLLGGLLWISGSVSHSYAAPLTGDPLSQLPSWMQSYFRWHDEMRTKFPGSQLFTEPDAPPLLIRTCLGLCGGLNDRLGQLPWDIYLANQTGRVFFLHWHRPVPLEHFLQPNRVDWSVPRNVPGFFSQHDVRVSRHDMKTVRSLPQLFEGYQEDGPEAGFWERDLDAALERATVGAFKDHKILRHRLLGHLNEDVLEQRLLKLGETDMIHNTATFGNLFWSLFQLSDPVKQQLQAVYEELHLKAHHYHGVHCRVRHPKSAPKQTDLRGKNQQYPADKTGLPWHGEARQFAIQTAARGLQCAKRHFGHDRHPVYFFSDSNDLVHYVTEELPKALEPDHSYNSTAERAAWTVVQAQQIVGRQASQENAHIDRQKGRDPPAYYSTFVDLMLAVNAKCLSCGIGYYCLLASKLSGGTCRVQYVNEHWGGSEAKTRNVPQCELPE